MSLEVVNVREVPPVPPRPDDAHKGVFGTVIVVGGCFTMPGAPALCAAAALRGGAGLVKIASSRDVLPMALGIEPGATGIVVDRVDDLAVNLDRADPQQRAVLAVGPGLGGGDEQRQLIKNTLAQPRDLVLDADGLNHLASLGRVPAVGGRRLVLTPHPGEFTRLAEPFRITANPTDDIQRPQAAAALAVACRAVVALKGHRTVVCDGQRLYLNTSGNPALATAGSGDVLTGLIAALLAQDMPPFEATVLGVYLHGLAADLWRQQHGPSGLTALDLAQLLPAAFHRHRGG